MRFCQHCGQPIRDQSYRFCMKCGRAVPLLGEEDPSVKNLETASAISQMEDPMRHDVELSEEVLIKQAHKKAEIAFPALLRLGTCRRCSRAVPFNAVFCPYCEVTNPVRLG